MVVSKEVDSRFKKLEKRLKAIEDYLEINSSVEEEALISEPVKPKSVSHRAKKTMPSFDFTHVITFLGVVGIVIGIISFFFYAVMNHWIGPTAQILIGIFVGFVLFGFAVILRNNNEVWSNIVLGGSYFVEYLAIGVGVLYYQVLNDYVGVGLTILFLVSSSALSINYKSRVIAYFTLVGGYLVPFITGMFNDDLFVLSYYIILSLGLVVLSFKEDWSDLKFVSFVFVSIFILSNIFHFSSDLNKAIPTLFLGVIFVLYNLSALMSAIKNKSEEFSILNSIILISLPIVLLIAFSQIFDFLAEIFGIFIMLFSFLYLIELLYFKYGGQEVHVSIIYSILSTGIVLLNVGILFMIQSFDADYFMILFVVQWFLYSVLSETVDRGKIYRIYSYICILLISYWYLYVLRFDNGIYHATFFMFVLASVVIGFFILFKKNYNYYVNAFGLVISGFLFIYSFYKYLWFLGIHSEQVSNIILSVLWLVYTLVLFSQSRTIQGKYLIGSLLGVTLLKIAFKDLFYLTGVFRIIGFIVFGVLLIVGGYFLKRINET